jgi:hypothetical protein
VWDTTDANFGGWFCRNRIEDCAVHISAAYTGWGPVTYALNTCVQLGGHSAPPLGDGRRRQLGNFCKYGSDGADVRATVQVWSCTCVTEDATCGGFKQDGSPGSGVPYFDQRNTVLCTTGGHNLAKLLSVSLSVPKVWSADGNCLYASHPVGSPWDIRGVTNFATYQQVTGQDAHGQWTDPRPWLVDYAGGDFHLKASADNPLLGKGVAITGFCTDGCNVGADQTTRLEDPTVLADLKEYLADMQALLGAARLETTREAIQAAIGSLQAAVA